MELEEELQELMSKKMENSVLEKEDYNIISLTNDFPEYQQIQKDVQTSLYYPYILYDENGQRLSRKRR